uniref:uncharacterized protein LOC122603067 n=1 Tax=Erigeron canadensis TaxID=72917 RepID=UPI001CB8E289|nr:uncharacterized protein LOC122603067 [Erigeron canadensis]
MSRSVWIQSEDLCLSRCWVLRRPDPVTGRCEMSIPGLSFWDDVTVMFNTETTGGPRSKSQLQGHWSKILKECKQFEVICTKLNAQERPGDDDEQYYATAHQIYREKHGRGFRYEHCFRQLIFVPF